MLAKDTQARVWVISGAWAVPLYLSGRSASDVRSEAARLQRIEHKFLKILRSPHARARIEIMTLAQFVEAPSDVLQAIIDEVAGHRGSAITELPEMLDWTGLTAFLQDLKNQGMDPFLTGNMADRPVAPGRRSAGPKPYVMKRK